MDANEGNGRQVIVQGLPVTSLLGVLFVALKLTGYINWSWFWVTAPFWMPMGAILAIFVVIVLGLAIVGAFSK